MTCIYKITSPSGKVYIGQTLDFKRRMKGHKRSGQEGNKYPTKISNSILCYGWNAHAAVIIHELPNGISKDILDQYEILYMEQYRSCGIELLNLAPGGRGQGKWDAERVEQRRILSTGRKHTNEAKQKVSIAQKGRIRTPEEIAKLKSLTGEKNSRFGVILSEETKQKMSDSAKGKKKGPMRQEHKDAIREGQKGKIRIILGRLPSENTKQKMREAQIARWVKIKQEKLLSQFKQ